MASDRTHTKNSDLRNPEATKTSGVRGSRPKMKVKLPYVPREKASSRYAVYGNGTYNNDLIKLAG